MSQDNSGWVMVPREIVDRFPEINVSNYGHDDACALNDWGVELVLAIKDEPAPAAERQDGRWLPMSSAPRDGSVFIANLTDSDTPVGVTWHRDEWYVAWDLTRLGEYDQPTRWMPSPDLAAKDAAPAPVDELRDLNGPEPSIPESVLSALLPGVWYMDPPDGGNPTILEQLRRQAEDAAKWVAHERANPAPAPAVSDAKDAERLDFIEAQWFYRTSDGGPLIFGFNETWEAPHKGSLREAIDTAIAARAEVSNGR